MSVKTCQCICRRTHVDNGQQQPTDPDGTLGSGAEDANVGAEDGKDGGDGGPYRDGEPLDLYRVGGEGVEDEAGEEELEEDAEPGDADG